MFLEKVILYQDYYWHNIKSVETGYFPQTGLSSLRQSSSNMLSYILIHELASIINTYIKKKGFLLTSEKCNNH